jgi:hypothetical protein
MSKQAAVLACYFGRAADIKKRACFALIGRGIEYPATFDKIE